MLPKQDAIRLRHMLEAARDVCSFVARRERPDLDRDRALAYAVINGIEIVGEAAAHVSAEPRAAHDDIACRTVVGMRNRLIHAYHDMNMDLVWRAAVEDLPPLIATLERILGEPLA
jgi:uncharacterized protein with HEPN domain